MHVMCDDGNKQSEKEVGNHEPLAVCIGSNASMASPNESLKSHKSYECGPVRGIRQNWFISFWCSYPISLSITMNTSKWVKRFSAVLKVFCFSSFDTVSCSPGIWVRCLWNAFKSQ